MCATSFTMLKFMSELETSIRWLTNRTSFLFFCVENWLPFSYVMIHMLPMAELKESRRNLPYCQTQLFFTLDHHALFPTLQLIAHYSTIFIICMSLHILSSHIILPFSLSVYHFTSCHYISCLIQLLEKKEERGR